MTPAGILAELATVLHDASTTPERLADLLLAPRVLIHGQGRAGLAMQALAMRLGQMGRDAHWLGDTAPPPLRPGDLLLVNASSGDLPTSVALLRRGQEIGARTALLTAAHDGPAFRYADTVLHIPAATLQGSTLPLGGQYELVLWLLGDLAVDIMMDRLGLTPADLAAGHVNLG